eukprot:819938-Alexandrium_andersonii.AAC.1
MARAARHESQRGRAVPRQMSEPPRAACGRREQEPQRTTLATLTETADCVGPHWTWQWKPGGRRRQVVRAV